MSGRYNLEDFAPHVGTQFRVPDIAGVPDGYELELASAEPAPAVEGAPRTDPFILVFTGPPGAYLPQGVYDLEHPELGITTIFIVPVGSAAPGGPNRYEAIFN